MDDERHGDGSGGGDRGHGRKGSDMPDLAQKPRYGNTAECKSDAIGGADEADGAGGKTFGETAQRYIGSLQAVAADEDTGSHEKRDKRSDLAHCGPTRFGGLD